jgi:hypothetical protein
MSVTGVATFKGETFHKPPSEIGEYRPGDYLVPGKKYIIRVKELGVEMEDFIGEYENKDNKKYRFKIIWKRDYLYDQVIHEWRRPTEKHKSFRLTPLDPKNPEKGTRAYIIKPDMQRQLDEKSPEEICQDKNAAKRTGLLCMIRKGVPAEPVQLASGFLGGGRKNKKSKKRSKKNNKKSKKIYLSKKNLL